MEKEKKKKIVWRAISWLLPIMVTFVLVFGIVFFCLEMELEFGIFISLAIIYVVWAIIIVIIVTVQPTPFISWLNCYQKFLKMYKKLLQFSSHCDINIYCQG